MTTQLPVDIDKDIKYILNQMNFKQISEVMEFLDWEWFGIGIPTQNELWLKGKSLLEDVYHKISSDDLDTQYSIKTGGFCAKGVKENGKYWLDLTFELDNASSPFEDEL